MMRTVLAGILLIVAAAIGLFAYQAMRTADGQPFGAPFALIDNKSQPITEATLRGHPSVMFFGYTHCPDVCPTTLVEMDDWLKKLGPQGAAIRAYFITVDPERDTADVMNNYVTNVSNRITGITGEPDKVWQMAKDYKIYYKKQPSSDGDYTMDHTATVLLLDSRGRFFGTIAYGEDSDTAIEKLKRLATTG